VAAWRARGWGRGVLDQSWGACHARPDAVPARWNCRAAELCAPAAELSPAATTCVPFTCHASACASRPAREVPVNMTCTKGQTAVEPSSPPCGLAGRQLPHRWRENREKRWGEEDGGTPKTLHCRHTQRCHHPVITLHACLALSVQIAVLCVSACVLACADILVERACQ
jgi:hypothetical protein